MSLKIDPKIERDLAKLADMQNVTFNSLLREFTITQAKYWEDLDEDMKRLDHIKKNGGIPHEEMMGWLEDLASGKPV